MATADVASKEGKAVEMRIYDRWVRNFQARTEENENGVRSEDILAGQAEKILTAETEDDFWDADEGGTISGKDIVGTALEILDYATAKSDDKYESSLGGYVNISATLLQSHKGYKPGEQVIINTGAPLIILKLEAVRAGNIPNVSFPLRCWIKATSAKNGDVLKLRPLSDLPSYAPAQ